MDLSHVCFEGRPAHVRLTGAVDGRGERVRPIARPADDQPIVGGLPAHVLAFGGLDPASYRRAPLDRRHGACLRALKLESEAAGLARLATDVEARDRALSALLIGVSDFFRDPAVFEEMRRLVIPALRERPRPLRIWSAGCSTGEELYTVALLLAEANLLADAQLIGTDCRADALKRAYDGVFSEQSVQHVDPALRIRYFERTPGGWGLVAPLRRAVQWQHADITRELPPGPWDVVLCRNVAIYLQHRTAARLFGGIVDRLSDGGFLIVGRAERPCASLRLRSIGRCLYRRDGHA